jgi:autotransporter passenger strand-loop-strand repeat protein
MEVTVSSGEYHFVDSGAVETSDLVEDGGTLNVAYLGQGGSISSTTVESGGVDTIWPTGSAFSTTLSGGTENVLGGYADFTTVVGGTQLSFSGGTAFDTQILSGFQVAFSGGYVEYSFVDGGGTLFVESGGSSNLAQVEGGVLAVEAGGSAGREPPTPRRMNSRMVSQTSASFRPRRSNPAEG